MRVAGLLLVPKLLDPADARNLRATIAALVVKPHPSNPAIVGGSSGHWQCRKLQLVDWSGQETPVLRFQAEGLGIAISVRGVFLGAFGCSLFKNAGSGSMQQIGKLQPFQL